MDEFEKALNECRLRKREDEEIVYALGAGRIVPMIGKRRQQKKALDYISKLEGFVGFYPMDLWHTLLLFRTLNNAKAGKNLLANKGVPIGQVVPVLVEKKYLEGARQ